MLSAQDKGNVKVCAIAVTWNCRSFALELVASLHAVKQANLDIIVVDNASTDGTAEAIQAQFPRVTLLQQPENTGGAGGFAIGMQWGVQRGYDFLWLLDGDARVTPDALGEMLVIARDEKVGVVGSQIVMADYPGIIQEIGGSIAPWSGRLRFHHAFEESRLDIEPQDVDYVAACSMLVRAQAAKDAGPFRSDLFIFFDDIDWCARARNAGYAVRTAPRSIVHHHFHGAKPAQPWRIYYGTRNKAEWHWRHGRGIERWLSSYLWIAHGLWNAARFREAGDSDLAEAATRAVEDFSRGDFGRKGFSDKSADLADDGEIDLSGCKVFYLCSGNLAEDLGSIRWWEKHHPQSTKLTVVGGGPITFLARFHRDIIPLPSFPAKADVREGEKMVAIVASDRVRSPRGVKRLLLHRGRLHEPVATEILRPLRSLLFFRIAFSSFILLMKKAFSGTRRAVMGTT